jgi:Asp/Glu/hydantoin racemase
MIRIAFVIGQYPADERKAREDAAKAYESNEVEIGFLSVPASPYKKMSAAAIETVHSQFHLAYVQAEREGYDAVVPLGMLDLGVEGGRCLVDIPVIAPFHATLTVASLVGDRLGIIGYERIDEPRNRARARAHGLEDRIVGFRFCNVSKEQMSADPGRLTETVVRLGRELVAEGAEVIVGAGPSVCPVQIKPQWLSAQLGVPVVESMGASIRLAAMLVHLKLSQSRVRWPKAALPG